MSKPSSPPSRSHKPTGPGDVDRLLVDASYLIGLAKAGGLDILHRSPFRVATTDVVLEEVVDPQFTETSLLEEAAEQDWLEVLSPPTSEDRSPPSLGPGDASLFLVRDETDLLVLDDGPARRLARAKGWPLTGTIGLLVASARRDWVDAREALRLLETLTETDFRLTVDLYRRARQRIEEASDGSTA